MDKSGMKKEIFDEPKQEQNNSLRKGKKGMRGQPIFYDEKKKKRSVMLTNTAWETIGDLAQAIDKSKSEWLELHIRAISGKNNF